MQPSVLRQIEQNQIRRRSRDIEPAVPCRGRFSTQRGPKDRPMYRLWEYATWRARMRVWCNEIKEPLLREDHDPGQPQTYKVIQAADCPIHSQSTWLHWWEGEAIPRPSHIAAAEKLVPRSSEVLDLTEMSTCLSRHFFALDVLNTKFRMTGRPSDYRRAQADRLLTGLNEAWSSFLDTSAPSEMSRHNIANQTGYSAETLLECCEIPAQHEVWARQFGGNRARWALPPEAVYEHSWLEPLSIFRFLARLAGSECLQHPALIDLWAVDLASATLAVRTLVESAGLRSPQHPTIRMGIAGWMHLLATATFSAPRSLLDQPETLKIARTVYGDKAETAIVNLCAARDNYYAAFAEIGISEKSLRALNGTHWEKTWDGAFSAARAKI
jgi:hypothetical protein